VHNTGVKIRSRHAPSVGRVFSDPAIAAGPKGPALRVLFLISVAVFFGIFAAITVTQAPATIWDGVYSEEQAKRGGATYQTFCGACHGDQLLGQEAAPALVGHAFNANWEGTTLGDLFNRIRTTMPLDQPGALSRAQTADVVAFMLQSGKFPAGAHAFDPQAMGMVMFRTYRP
jgi:S-disulfanyl-L-cysteine oxidoreductase SoxD